MFDNLISFEPPPEYLSDMATVALADATPDQVLSGQIATKDWLEQSGVPSDEEIDNRMQREDARRAFETLSFSSSEEAQKKALTNLKVPSAVQHLVGMLTAYDWEFVEQAKELRGYAVSQILEETKHPDARIRLKALQMLGNITEVALFTERVEVKKIDATEEELEKRLRARLERFITPEDGLEIKVLEATEDVPVVEDDLDVEIGQVAEARK